MKMDYTLKKLGFYLGKLAETLIRSVFCSRIHSIPSSLCSVSILCATEVLSFNLRQF